jgi:hypothetical protein
VRINVTVGGREWPVGLSLAAFRLSLTPLVTLGAPSIAAWR